MKWIHIFLKWNEIKFRKIKSKQNINDLEQSVYLLKICILNLIAISYENVEINWKVCEKNNITS